MKLSLGQTEGLVYLHENSKTRIIQRDIKASNILLDAKLRAKIADFGSARSFDEDESHISTAIAGALGYMAPGYLAHGQLTEKADAWKHFHAGTAEQLFDPNLEWQDEHNSNNKDEIFRVVRIGLLCTQEAPSLRPSMSKALKM
ncbi:hypothetical protein Fmac_031208 [Flemingia macrophylla]|uniref:Protein kinase domain-containing protein n=1 Tax=Flemingia macrophylla TaxID=520843 RepID=A0ABD1L1F6_9FABA